MTRKRRTPPADAPPAPSGTDTPTPEAPGSDPDAGDETPEARFRALLDSLPTDAAVSCSLKRLPSYLTPLVRTPEDLPPPDVDSDYDAMLSEVRLRYGPGKYKLYIRYHDPASGRRRMVAPTFVLAPGPDDGAAWPARGEDTPSEPDAPEAGDKIRASLDRLRSAIETKAQAAELAALERAATGQAPPGAPADPFAAVRSIADLIRSLVPPPPDPLALLKNARDLVAPPTTADAGSNVAMMRELLGLLREVAPEGGSGRRSAWELVVPELFGLLREVGPGLLSFLTAAAQRTAPLPATTGAPPPGPVRSAPDPPRLSAPVAPALVDADIVLRLAAASARREYATPEARLESLALVVDAMLELAPDYGRGLAALGADELIRQASAHPYFLGIAPDLLASWVPAFLSELQSALRPTEAPSSEGSSAPTES